MLGTLAVVAGWVVAVVGLAGAAAWTVGRVVGSTSTDGDGHDLADVQVRILTTDDEVAARGTAATLPDALDRDQVRVVATSEIHVPDAIVHVVPEEFEGTGDGMARALAWARKHVPCDREYVWYVDDASAVLDVDSLPDADVVRFRSSPSPDGSALAYWSEVIRVGARADVPARARLAVRPAAFRGAVAVRNELDSAAADAAFAWPDAAGSSVAVVDDGVRTAAPSSLAALVRDRVAWVHAALEPALSLGPGDRAAVLGRAFGVALAPLAPLAVLAALVAPASAPATGVLVAAAGCFLATAMAWFAFGARRDPRRSVRDAVTDPLDPAIRAVRRSLSDVTRSTAAPDPETAGDGGIEPQRDDVEPPRPPERD